MNLEQIVALLGKSERNEAVQKMLSHYGIKQPLARPKQEKNPVTPIDLKDSHGIALIFGKVKNQAYCTDAYLEDELYFTSLFYFPTKQAVADGLALPAGVKVRSNLERQIEDLGEPILKTVKTETAGMYMWHCDSFNVAFDYSDIGNKINWIMYCIHPPLIDEVIEFINGYEHGTFGWFDLCEIEQIPREWNPDNAERLQEAGYSFLPLPDGSMVALLKTDSGPDAVVYIGSEGERWTIANSLEAFLILWSKGETGIDDLDDEECADGHEELAEWLKSKQIKAPAAADFDFQAWLDEKPEAKPATVAPVKQEPAKVMDSPEKGGLLKTVKQFATGLFGSKPRKSEPLAASDIIALLGKPINDPAVASLLREQFGTKSRPETDYENGQYFGWLYAPDKGFSLLFSDSEYRKGGDSALWGSGELCLNIAAFYVATQNSPTFQGKLPFGLDFSDSKATARRKMSPYEATRHSFITDTWDTEGFRVNIFYSDNYSSIKRVVCLLPEGAVVRKLPLTYPTVNQLLNALDKGVRDPLFTGLWREEDNEKIQKSVSEMSVSEDWSESVLLDESYGVDLYFNEEEQVWAIVLCGNRYFNSVDWEGELIQGLDFDDSPEMAFQKFQREPDEREDDMENSIGYATWRFPAFDVKIVYSHESNRIYRIALRSPYSEESENEASKDDESENEAVEDEAVEDESLYRVKFPNPFGYALPKESEVRKLQKRYGFSDGYAEFLMQHNGLDCYACKDFGQEEFFVPDASRDADDIGEDIRYLFSVNSGNEYSDLKGNLEDWKMLLPYFFPIGDDAGGNVFVEVLVGPLKGAIGNLDHGRLYSVDTLAELLEEEEDAELEDMTEEQMIELLTSEDLDLFWLHAPSMEVFVRDCIFAKGDSFGVIDYEQPDEGEAAPSGGKSATNPANDAPEKQD
ncbi:MAG: SMI1/KNR4 family protein [Zoogloeaceae bacterium]|jgi:hypothetical protein|nr:SMI1/KNR4 family protein [Zoogloeaceae bacterium]